MNNVRTNTSKAFTLVELIVVIAIVAVLTAVVIPAFTRFIDQGRFSNDVQKAASMTKILEAHRIGSSEALDAHRVREIIEEYHGSEFSFTPEASNTGYFYLENQNRIVASKYDDAEGMDTLLRLEEHLLLNHELNAQLFNSPAEVFGKGTHLLTLEGSPIAVAVDFIYQLANSGGRLDADYQLGASTLEDYQKLNIINALLNLFKLGISAELVEKVEALIDFYDPSTTLYVNNVVWTTAAFEGNNINKIVFAQGISNIPTFNLTLTNIGFTTVSLPSTVRTIESNAFKDTVFESLDEIIYRGVEVLKIASDAFKEGMQLSFVTSDFEGVEITGIKVTFTYENGNFNIILDSLLDYLKNNGYRLKSYRIEMDLDDLLIGTNNSRVHIYTNQGYLGFVIPQPEVPEDK